MRKSWILILNMNIFLVDCGFWQTCKLIDFYSQGDSGILYSIDFKGNLLMVFQTEIRVIKNKNQLFMPLKPKTLNHDVVFQ